jgi:hypothetical protein
MLLIDILTLQNSYPGLIFGETLTVLRAAFKVRVYKRSGTGGFTFNEQGFFTVNWND